MRHFFSKYCANTETQNIYANRLVHESLRSSQKVNEESRTPRNFGLLLTLLGTNVRFIV